MSVEEQVGVFTGGSAADWIHAETLAVLRNMDTELRATGRVSARIERLINLIAGSKPVAAPASPSAAVVPEAQRVRIAADGRHLRDYDPTPHVAVFDKATGLMWSITSIGTPNGDGMSQNACAKACAELDLLGHRDWRLSTRSELAALVDDTRHDPAIDTALFPGVKSCLHWTSTAAALPLSPAAAWYVDFYDGSVNIGYRSYRRFALAVRDAGATP